MFKQPASLTSQPTGAVSRSTESIRGVRIVLARGSGGSGRRSLSVLVIVLVLAGVSLGQASSRVAWAQAGPSLQGPQPADNEDAQLDALAAGDEANVPPPTTDEPSGIDMITLIGRGGVFMWPIGFMSLLVVTLAVERVVSFRRSRMMPPSLTRRLSRLIEEGNGDLDAEAALEACRQQRSVAANVMQAMLLRAGRPLGEIEQAASETAQREADDQAGPIRWLNLAAAATPLMGLLGTVWGMIVAFHDSATLTAERSRSEQLSEGIYTALVTTLAGLAVAIPAAIMAQYLENRLTKIFHRIEKMAFNVAPALEHYTGKARMDASARLRTTTSGNGGVTPPPVITRPRDAAESTARNR